MGTSTSMSVKVFSTVAPMLPGDISILLRGNHGIGKSQVVRQVAQKIAELNNIDRFEVIDRRLSQMSEGDMIGLPSTDGEVTRFNPPDWFKRACINPCCLFLDELNRATHEVMQAAFQIVLDRELNGWKLHPQTRVFSAVNSSNAYTVNEIDPALLDRFWCIDLEPSIEDWLLWAKGTGTMHSTVIDFIATNEKWLDPPKNAEPGSIHTSRRSWERLNNSLVASDLMENPQNELFYSMSLGFIGVEAAQAFKSFASSIDNRVTGEDIVENYAFSWNSDKKSKKKEMIPSDGKVKQKIARLGQEKQNVAIEKVIDYVSKNCSNFNEVQGNNVKEFMNDLTPELRISCWSKLAQVGVEKFELLQSLRKYCIKGLLDVFGVPEGQAGVGVMPNIPNLFENKK
jgi:hypothetical protein